MFLFAITIEHPSNDQGIFIVNTHHHHYHHHHNNHLKVIPSFAWEQHLNSNEKKRYKNLLNDANPR